MLGKVHLPQNNTRDSDGVNARLKRNRHIHIEQDFVLHVSSTTVSPYYKKRFIIGDTYSFVCFCRVLRKARENFLSSKMN